ncbi:hypothetical protein [Evtepia sp.]|uniref:hypothetical protein n=1 Tax=Evtepia sp. TaxID=2773933 RepID=UPI002A82D862|nr:hypothetical protein [Evtepia sp.]MDY4430186.1 hypothetical protein [Evtepia sp.]
MEKEYITLFNAITDAIAQLESAKQFLQDAQVKAEELYIMREEDEPIEKAAP